MRDQSNLPPGVTTNMIPGNRPGDDDDEAFWEIFATKLEEAKIPAEDSDWTDFDNQWHNAEFVKCIEIARDIGYTHGHNEGQADAEVAIASMEEEIATQLYDWLQVRPHASAKQLLRKMAEIRTHVKMRAD